jgi:3-phosphoshikimate 1-carboxyvinyltransferase
VDYIVQPSTISDAVVRVPGDKSISHRAVMLGSLAEGRTEVSGFLAGEDCLATMAAFRHMGVAIEQSSPTELLIDGVGLDGLNDPRQSLDLGNSGTAMRLMAGLMAGQAFSSELTGDESLSGRPMQRVITPLRAMGAVIESDNGTPPLRIAGGRPLQGIEYAMPVASAQVKSSVLLAGLYASGTTVVTEPAVTRDHTERMLRSMGVDVRSSAGRISMRGRQPLRACPVQVPADLSSAAFLILAALLAEDANILIPDVGVNPTRTGVIDILRTMGAHIELENPRELGDEPVADLRIFSSELQGIDVDPGLVSLAIDEFPVLFVAAGAARGRTVFSGLAELRVKESDRIAAMAAGLSALGIDVDEQPDGAVVTGGRFSGGDVGSFGDHRVAMSLAVAGTAAEGPVHIRDVAAVDTSFPGFVTSLKSCGADISQGEGSEG